jgi:hypothetical protein
MDKMDKEIEDIRRLMLNSVKDIASKRWRMKRINCSGKINGALQHNVWKLGGEPTVAAT